LIIFLALSVGGWTDHRTGLPDRDAGRFVVREDVWEKEWVDAGVNDARSRGEKTGWMRRLGDKSADRIFPAVLHGASQGQRAQETVHKRKSGAVKS
jgi:hypothetical protein